MLYVSNNGETCKDQLCQHPECWQTNVRRVRRAVSQRNGIVEETQVVNEPRKLRLRRKKKLTIPHNENDSLPTLKVIDITRSITTSFANGNDDDEDDKVLVEKDSPSYSTSHLSPLTTIRNKHCISFGMQAPRTTPVSPSIPEIGRQTRWKEKISCSVTDDEKANKISFHELYDYEEVYQDWQETFISTAYLVWCPSKKQERIKSSRARSATTDQKTRGYKDILENALPLPVEETPKKRRDAKYPTGGQPYSPCRSSAMKYDHFKLPLDDSDEDFVPTVTKEKIPQPLVTSKKIIEQRTRSATTMAKDRPHSQARESDNVHVDISSRLSSLPIVNKDRPTSSKVGRVVKGEEQEKILDTKQCVKKVKPKRPKTAGASQKQLSDFEPRKVLPLPSVGIPWGLIPEERRDHCKNSIPHGRELGVVMEPVIYQARSASARGSMKKTGASVHPNKGGNLNEERNLDKSMENSDERNNLTSSYRLSPKRLLAPAPTPITPASRDGVRRQLSDLIQSNATRSSSESVLPGHSCPKTPHRAPCAKRSKSLDHVILEVEETNRDTFRKFVDETNDGRDEKPPGTANLDESADKVNDSESAIFSLRAVSPSSRTNIPPDIWAQLRGDLVADRRMTPGEHLELRRHERVYSTVMARGFHSCLGLSVYSYTESSWKPTKLPQSFIGVRTCQGAYHQTVLPRMPASLTVVPVPRVTRSVKGTAEPRRYHLAQSSSNKLPPVPVASPIFEIDVTIPSAKKICSQTVPGSNKSSELRVVSEGTGPEHQDEDDDVPGEVEYLIARDVVSHQDRDVHESVEEEQEKVGNEIHGMTIGELGLNLKVSSAQEMFVRNEQHPFDLEGSFTEEMGIRNEQNPPDLKESSTQKMSIRNEQDLFDLKECSTQEVATRGEQHKPDLKDSSVEVALINGQAATISERASLDLGDGSEAWQKAEYRGGSELCENESDMGTPQEKLDDSTTIETVEVERKKVDVDAETIPVECTKVDNAKTVAVDRGEIEDAEVATETRVTTAIKVESGPGSGPEPEPQASVPEISGSSRPVEVRVQSVEELGIESAGKNTASAKQDLSETLSPGSSEQTLPAVSHESLLSKDSDDFQLEPFSVESELLRPIHIDSDLLLLSADSYLKLSFDESELDVFDGGSEGTSSPFKKVQR